MHRTPDRGSAGALVHRARQVQTPAQVAPLAAQADASPEITSRIAPDAVRPAASNPLIDAAKQIAAQSTAFKKEI